MGAEIKFRWGGKIPYVAENVQNVRSAVTQAVKEGADLGGAYLGGAYLHGADLYGANLGGADLGRADLRGADLREAYLAEANLGRADLRGANLGNAYLHGVNLYGARLEGAYLEGAYLCRADLLGTELLEKYQDLESPGVDAAKIIRRISALRKRRRLTQKDISERIGTKQSVISRFEAGQDAYFSTVVAYIWALDVDINRVLDFENLFIPYLLSVGPAKESTESSDE